MRSKIITALIGLTVTLAASGCGQNPLQEDKRSAEGNNEETSTELLGKKNPNYKFLLEKIVSNVNMKGGKAPKKSIDPNAVFAAFNKESGARVKAPAEAKTKNFNLATTNRVITAEQICEGYGLEPGTPEYSTCVTNVKAYIGEGIIDWSWDPTIPAVRVITFPMTVPGYGSGICLYARVSLLAIGIACGSPAGGVWAGCEVWGGCGSGAF